MKKDILIKGDFDSEIDSEYAVKVCRQANNKNKEYIDRIIRALEKI